ncbi:MAG TPA: hypothetical protein VFY92_07785, partial [Hyphomicrobiaceae bacterium]|nr:hypothetical protein [Hyphomicrobiaceae bacterium]
VWVVVTGYALTSALGHAALNRMTTSGQRAAASDTYQDLRADRKRLEAEFKTLGDQLSWIPAHRPPETVRAEVRVQEAQRAWLTTKECTDVTLRSSRDFCKHYGELKAELASGENYSRLEVQRAEIGARIAALSGQSAKVDGAAVMGMADPQANVLAKLLGIDLETVQIGLTLFVALLIEVGSGFGMYVAFAYWRPNQSLHSLGQDPLPPRTVVELEPVRKEDEKMPAAKADPIWTAEPAALAPPKAEADKAGEDTSPPPVRQYGDNDNQSAKPAIMPPSDVEKFYQDYVDSAGEGDWIASMDLNEAYKLWCKKNERRPLAMPKFTSEFDRLKVVKHGIGGGVKYFGIALKPEVERELERKGSRKRKSALGTESVLDQSRPAATPGSATAAVDKTAQEVEVLRAAAGEMRTSAEKPEAGRDEAKAA